MNLLKKWGARALSFFGLLSVAGLASATTTLTTLPTAAATATDSLIAAAADVSTILFGIGVPMVLAWVGFKVFKKAASKAT